MPVSSVIVGVDIVPIRPIPNVITITADITTSACRAAVHKALHTWKADVVLHDGSPNVGIAWSQDAFGQNELVLAALRLATELLRPGGTFVTKVFRSRDYNAILTTLGKLFTKVTASKPAASRTSSAEVFVVCQGYTAPKRVDPALVDPKVAFAADKEQDAVPVISVMSKRAMRPRKATGYEDEQGALVTKCVPAMEFVMAEDPLMLLSAATEITFGEADAEARAHPATTNEIVETMRDLKVLGKAEFRNILRWRDAVHRTLAPKA
jgi:AdoMet-dependent rRNA methyltransferase SPB1